MLAMLFFWMFFQVSMEAQRDHRDHNYTVFWVFFWSFPAAVEPQTNSFDLELMESVRVLINTWRFPQPVAVLLPPCSAHALLSSFHLLHLVSRTRFFGCCQPEELFPPAEAACLCGQEELSDIWISKHISFHRWKLGLRVSGFRCICGDGKKNKTIRVSDPCDQDQVIRLCQRESGYTKCDLTGWVHGETPTHFLEILEWKLKGKISPREVSVQKSTFITRPFCVCARSY